MIAVMPILRRVLFSRAGLIAMIVLVLWAWHRIDKGSAVRDAVTRYVADVEIEALEAENERLRAITQATEEANRKLREGILSADAARRAADNRIETYETETPPPADCAVSGDLLDILRGN